MKLSAITPVLLGLTASAVNAYSVEYSTETGYFLQDESSTDPSTFDYVCGLHRNHRYIPPSSLLCSIYIIH